jgi:hypothetical protein
LVGGVSDLNFALSVEELNEKTDSSPPLTVGVDKPGREDGVECRRRADDAANDAGDAGVSGNSAVSSSRQAWGDDVASVDLSQSSQGIRLSHDVKRTHEGLKLLAVS